MRNHAKRAEKQAKRLRRELERMERGQMGFTQERDMPAVYCEHILDLLRERRRHHTGLGHGHLKRSHKR